MNKYLVTFCYSRYESVEIEANSHEEACEQAFAEATCPVTSDCYEIVDCTEISE